ncbi:uncharacterized protein LOC124337002 [Daphnia pulicaria]|uniref:uncharacterized protein LOC124337002 n=1 Tax=Daphnia pulicaria TaxID=35523 RepID=UPI001EEB81C7|nr:uncharacterized protein LOC124337002 [Daphnia pulicaria]
MAKLEFFSIHLSLSLLFSVWQTSAALSLEDQVKRLTENYVSLNEVVATKNVQLETKVMALETKVAALEAKNVELETKVQHHDILVEKFARLEIALQQAESQRTSQLSVKNSMPRTCREARAADPSLSSGMYWIDPDGQGVGDDPIYVYCDMAKGSTAIPHDSESPMDVGHCADPGCYSRTIRYNASSRQISALAELSAECHQSIKYDCNFAPLELNTITYAWWNDKNGNAKTFWAGGNTDVHLCQCGLDGNCVDSSTKCNCDSAAPVPLTDEGVITDKEVLPVTRLNYGRTQLETSSGIHQLGRFECTGQVAVTGIPTSCADLWRRGHTLSGLYSVVGAKMVERVYCDFTKLPDDAGFQRWIGFEDVKSSPTYFYVKKTSPFNQAGVPVPFEIVELNVGGAMNETTWIFTAPRPGKYFFSASGIAFLPSSTSKVALWIRLMKNGNPMSYGLADESNTSGEYETFSLQSTLSLQAGDQIWLEILQIDPGVTLHNSLNSYTHFNGFLIEEDISQSLATFV